jgi:hypothetical protein
VQTFIVLLCSLQVIYNVWSMLTHRHKNIQTLQIVVDEMSKTVGPNLVAGVFVIAAAMTYPFAIIIYYLAYKYGFEILVFAGVSSWIALEVQYIPFYIRLYRLWRRS